MNNKFLEASGCNLYFLDFISTKIGALHQPKRFLEIGCGTGVFAENLAIASGMTAYGTELSISAAKIAAARLHCHHVNDYHLPFSDSYFDLVVAKDVIPMITNKHDWLSEIYRVLCHGGLFISYIPVHKDFLEKPLYNFIPGSLDASLFAYGAFADFVSAMTSNGLAPETTRLPLGTVEINQEYTKKHLSGFFSNSETPELDNPRRLGLESLRIGSHALAASGLHIHYEWERTAIIGTKK